MLNTSQYQKIAQQFGSPAYIFYPEVLRSRIKEFQSAFKALHQNTTVAYSLKTNYLPAVISAAATAGAVPEAIPGLEIDILNQLNLLTPKVIINGPLKTRPELERLVAIGCRVNVDNPSELEILNQIAEAQNKVVAVGIRISGEISTGNWMRYGFNIESGDAENAAQKIYEDYQGLSLVGLHVHLGTNILETKTYELAAQALVKLAADLREKNFLNLQYLDLGGGFATDCPYLDADPDLWRVPQVEEYAEALLEPICKVFGSSEVEVIIEPGRALVDESFELLTTVSAFRSEKNEAIVDAGQNIFPSCRFRSHRIKLVEERAGKKRPWTLHGPLCMPSDCIGRNVSLPPLKLGDLLVADYAGAYSISQAWQFIRYQAPVVLVNEGGEICEVRRRENAESLFSRDIMG